jgi:pilus assembly protein CpaB
MGVSIMNVKSWLPLCIALVLGLVAAKFAKDHMAKNRNGNAVASSKTVQVVVAKESISAGDSLSEENCQLGAVAADNVPEGSFRSVAELRDRVAQLYLGRGQPITENLLAPTGTGSGLQAVIPPGMRAISVEVNEFSSVGGMLLPGCHVDVLATVPGENNGEMIARTVVQNVTVTAVGQRMTPKPKDGEEPQAFRSVTLLASPSEAEAIELAAVSGRPRLVLRNTNDKVLTNTPGVTAAALRGSSPVRKIEKIESQQAKVVMLPPPEPTFNVIKVIRGTVESEVRMIDGWYESKPVPTANTDTKAVSGSETAPMTGRN